MGITLVVSGGNHDNWETIEKMSPEEDRLCTFRSTIRVLPRGERTIISGLVIGALGGAFSIDQVHRIQGKDWWANGEPQQEEAGKLISGGLIDILLTHDPPSGVPVVSNFELSKEMFDRANRSRLLIREVVDVLVPAHVFRGHWHQRLFHMLVHPDGRHTRVDVLDKEYSRNGNAVLVWPGPAPF